jgi:membrane protein
MEYLLATVFTIFYLMPFLLMSNLVFKLLQMPFALIHRHAARAVVVLQIYMLCQYFSTFVMSFTGELPFVKGYMRITVSNPIILMVICTVILIFVMLSMAFSAADKDRNFLLILSILSVPALWVIYLCKITFIYQPVQWFFWLIEWLLAIPILGNILGFAMVGFGLFFIFKLVVLLPMAIVRLIADSKQDKNTRPANTTNAEYIPQTYMDGYTPGTAYETSAVDISESPQSE